MSSPTSERFAALALLLAIAGCGRGADEATEPRSLPVATPIACTLGGRAARCGVERRRAGERVELVLTRPDGGFRRVLISASGGQVTAADGAAPATLARVSPREVEVRIEGDRYRLPATVR